MQCNCNVPLKIWIHADLCDSGAVQARVLDSTIPSSTSVASRYLADGLSLRHSAAAADGDDVEDGYTVI